MNPLSLLYGAVTGARNLVYDTGLFTARLRAPVVSIGNISVGGTGKTPFIIYLGERLKQRGVSFDVLSRGYGRTSKGVRVVDPAGSPRDFGDEPLLIARKLGVPVIVGASRYHAGLVAEQRFGPQLHLLDDGFQHRQLHRDLDIVLFGEGDLEDKLLPAGRLREPVSALERADVVIAESAETLSRDKTGARRRTCAPTLLKMDRTMTVGLERAGSYVAFCGVARPHGFFAGLREAGVNVVGKCTFRDHHAYSEADVQELQRIRESSGAAGFFTTEKDEINLGDLASKLSPLLVAKLNLSMERPEELLEAVMRVAAGAKAAKS
jgi:tetraacyldisaccharide 4'-kinase